jgi:PucR C-terminal helix-turn-helix domain/GGDEF-like domain
VSTAIRRLADWIDDEAEMLAERMLERARQEVSEPGLDADPAVAQTSRDGTIAHLRAICGGLLGGRMLPARPPPAAVEQTIALAEGGLSWSMLMRRLTFGHAELWDAILDETDEWELTAEETSLFLQVVSRFLFSYRDYVTTELTDVYEAQRERIVRSREHRRIGLVRELLDGLPASERELGYRLRAQHLGVIAWGERAEDALVALARSSGTELLYVPGGGRSLWAWYGGGERVEEQVLATLAAAPPGDGVSLALGGQTTGLGGFAQTHREAMQAFRVASTRPQALTRYEDVVLEALALTNARDAREFAQRELGALAAPDARTATLRKTLRAYFQAGNNRAAAAVLLTVHERTVGYRLSAIEQLLGYDIGQRREELGMALRVQRLLEAPAGADER